MNTFSQLILLKQVGCKSLAVKSGKHLSVWNGRDNRNT